MADSDSDDAERAAYSIILSSLLQKKKKKKPKRWSSQLYLNRKRQLTENSTGLLKDLLADNKTSGFFKNFTRMSEEDFFLLLNCIKPRIQRQDTSYRKAIPAEERLALTLRFLATGDSFTSLQYLFKVSKQLISEIVPEVCQAIIESLSDYVQIPLTEEKWAHIAQQFENKWNFPKCIGAIDGKHVVLQAPINSGSEYINYKSHFSIVLMATADADYNFTFVDIGCQGRISDGGVFSNTILSKKLDKQELKLPPCSPLNGREKPVPFVFVADAAFPLKDNILKPYAGYHPKGSTQRIFNYRLSRARRIIENTFGIASSVFRVLRKPMLLEPEKAKHVVMAIVSLHNFLRRSKTSRNIYPPRGSFDTELLDGAIIPGVWRNEEQSTSSFLPLRNVPRRTKLSCQETRDEFAQYFMTNGAVSWQNNYA